MALADNIIKLRKQAGWSQEALAAQVGVSRQSVSKWESGQSTPDIEHILTLAEAFQVTTDALLDAKSSGQSITEENTTDANTLSDRGIAQNYVGYKIDEAAMITRGVRWCVMAPSALFAMLAIHHLVPDTLPMSLALVFGLVAILGMVAKGVKCFIAAQQLQGPLLPDAPFSLSAALQEELTSIQQQQRPDIQKQLTIGISLFVLCAAPLLIAALLGMGSSAIFLSLVLLLWLVATGLQYVIPTSARRDAIVFLLQGGDMDAGKSDDTKRAERLAGVYWPLLVAIYLGWSFWTMNWGVTWIIFPVGAVAFGGVVGLAKLLERK